MIRNRGPATRALLLLTLSIGVALAAQIAIANHDAGRLGALLYAIAAVTGIVAMRRIDRIEPAVDPTRIDTTARIETTLVAIGAVAVGGSLYVLAATNARDVAVWLWLAGLLLIAAGVAGRGVPTAAPAEAAPPTRRTLELLVLGMILLAALASRLPYLTQIPPEVHGDEAACGLEARRLLHGDLGGIFGVGWYHIPNLSFAIAAPFMAVFGDNLWGFRMASVVQSLVSIALLFLLVRRLLTARVAAIAAAWLAISHWYVHFSRIGTNYQQAALMTLLVLYLLVCGVQSRRILHWLLAGFASGVCFTVYYGARLAPLIGSIYVLHRCASEPGFLRSQWRGMAAMGLGALLFLSPWTVEFSKDPHAFVSRAEGVFLLTAKGLEHASYTYKTDSTWDVLRLQALYTATALHQRGETSMQHGHRAPLLDFWSAAIFVIGLAYATFRLRTSSYALLSAWFWLTMILGSVLTIDAMFSPRVIGAVPVVFVFPALVLDAACRGAARVGGVWGTRTGFLFVIALWAASARDNFTSYFDLHIHALQPAGGNTLLARAVASANEEYQAYVTGPFSLNYDTERFLLPVVDGVDVREDELPLPLNRIPDRKGVAFFVALAEAQAQERSQAIERTYPDSDSFLIRAANGTPVFRVHRVAHDDLLRAKPDAARDVRPIPAWSVAELRRRPIGGLDAGTTPARVGAATPRGPWLELGLDAQPVAIAVLRTNEVLLVVLDRASRQIVGYDSGGRVALTTAETSWAVLDDPTALAVAPDGTILALDAAQPAVQVFDSTGHYVRTVPLARACAGSMLAVDHTGGVVVSLPGANQIRRIQPFSRLVSDPDLTADPLQGLRQPSGLAVGSDGTLFVVDGLNERMAIFGSDLAYRGAWTIPAAPVPPGAAVAIASGQIFLTRPDWGQVVEFDVSGRQKGSIGVGELDHPVAVAHDGDRTLFVLDAERRAVFAYSTLEARDEADE